MNFWEEKAVEKLQKYYAPLKEKWKLDEDAPYILEDRNAKQVQKLPDEVYYLDDQWFDWTADNIDDREMEFSWNDTPAFDPYIEGPVSMPTVKVPVEEVFPEFDKPNNRLFPWPRLTDYLPDATPNEIEMDLNVEKKLFLMLNSQEHKPELLLRMKQNALRSIIKGRGNDEKVRQEVKKNMERLALSDGLAPRPDQPDLTRDELLYKIDSMERQMMSEEWVVNSSFYEADDDYTFARFQAEQFAVIPACYRQFDAYQHCTFDDCLYEEEELNACAYDVMEKVNQSCKPILQELKVCFEAPDEEGLSVREMNFAPGLVDPSDLDWDDAAAYPNRPGNQGILFELNPELARKPFTFSVYKNDPRVEGWDKLNYDRLYRNKIIEFGNYCTNVQQRLYNCLADTDPSIADRQKRGIDAIRKRMLNTGKLLTGFPVWVGGPQDASLDYSEFLEKGGLGIARNQYSHLNRGVFKLNERIYEPDGMQPSQLMLPNNLDTETDYVDLSDDPDDDEDYRWWHDFDLEDQDYADSKDVHYTDDITQDFEIDEGIESQTFQEGWANYHDHHNMRKMSRRKAI